MLVLIRLLLFFWQISTIFDNEMVRANPALHSLNPRLYLKNVSKNRVCYSNSLNTLSILFLHAEHSCAISHARFHMTRS